MTEFNYQKIWNVMNDLEMVTTKISSAREILDSAIDKLEEHQYDKAGTLLYAVDEFLQYYLQEFDTKFKDAWKETVSKVKQQEIDDCMPPWGHSDLEYLCKNNNKNEIWETGQITDELMETIKREGYDYTPIPSKKKWKLPVEVENDYITGEKEYFITFPDDLLEAANLSPGDNVEWVDRNDGSFLLRKITQPKTYTEMVAAGYTMTADGFWIKE
jgi:hypothetical protein